MYFFPHLAHKVASLQFLVAMPLRVPNGEKNYVTYRQNDTCNGCFKDSFTGIAKGRVQIGINKRFLGNFLTKPKNIYSNFSLAWCVHATLNSAIDLASKESYYTVI